MILSKKKNRKNKINTPATSVETQPQTEDFDDLISEAQSGFAPIPHSDSFSEEDFSRSVNNLAAGDITPTEMDSDREELKPKKKKRSRTENIIQLSLLAVCAIVAAVCVVMLIDNIHGKVRGAQIYENTEFDGFLLDSDEEKDSFNHPSALLSINGDSPMLTLYNRISEGKTPEEKNNGAYSEKLAAMKASLTALKAKNPDIIGWIYAENTGINYPILRGDDNDYYLDHAYTGESLPIGSIFMDCNAGDSLSENQNTVIYGHNVVTGAMFHDVTKFLDPDFFAKNKIYIYTMEGVYIYNVVSVYPTTEKYFYYRMKFRDSGDFTSFAAEVISKSSVTSGEKFSENDKMLTLSTCTNGSDGGRYALHAKLTETVK